MLKVFDKNLSIGHITIWQNENLYTSDEMLLKVNKGEFIISEYPNMLLTSLQIVMEKQDETHVQTATTSTFSVTISHDANSDIVTLRFQNPMATMPERVQMSLVHYDLLASTIMAYWQ